MKRHVRRYRFLIRINQTSIDAITTNALAMTFFVASVLLALFTSLALAQDSNYHCEELSEMDEMIHHLVPIDRVTHEFIRDGKWSDPSSWSSNSLPTSGANVIIHRDVNAVIDYDLSDVRLETLRVDGTLTITSHTDLGYTTNTGLKVVTMVISCGARFFVGEPDIPIASEVEARITFASRGDRIYSEDPMDLSGGLLAQEGATIKIYGSMRTSYAIAASSLNQGSYTIELTETPVDWKIGDRIVIPGVRPWRTKANEGDPANAEDEVFTIHSIDGHIISLGFKYDLNRLATLQHDHIPPLVTGIGNKPLLIPIGNLNRNVIFQSEDKRRPHRGHILFANAMPNVHIEYAKFLDLGRTDTRYLIAGHGTPDVIPPNTKSRYPIHFHQVNNASYDNHPHLVKGSVVEGSLKHGIVNHGGHVNMFENIGYNNAGSHFFMENGQELGIVKGNLAIFSHGSNDFIFNGDPATLARSKSGDFGHAGHGYWGHGGGVVFIDNYAFSHAHAAYIIYPLDIGDGDDVLKFARHKLLVESNSQLTDYPYLQVYLNNKAKIHAYLETNGENSLHIGDIPIFAANNVGASSLDGMRIGFRARPGIEGLDFCLPYYPCIPDLQPIGVSKLNLHNLFRSYIVDSQFWNNRRDALFYGYSMLARLSSLTLVGPPDVLEGTGIARSDNDMNGYIDYEHILVIGFDTGVELPLQGINHANNIVLMDNNTGLYLQTAAGPREISMINIGMYNNSEDIEMSPPIWYQGGSIGDLFYKDIVTLNHERLYFPEQSPNARPLMDYHLSENSDINTQQTARELWQNKGLAIGGQLEGETRFIGNTRLANYCQRYRRKDESKFYLYDEAGNFKVITYPKPHQQDNGWIVVPLIHENSTPHSVLIHIGDTGHSNDAMAGNLEIGGVESDAFCQN